jgi:hypothetical protein
MGHCGRHQTERIGVTYCQSFFVGTLGWIFREQTVSDYGIDTHAEVVTDDNPTGKLLAIQIKAGASFFREEQPDGWLFRPKERHVSYWLAHSLPVIVVLVDTDTESAYWQSVSKETLERSSRGGWKLLVPSEQKLTASAASILARLAEGDPYTLRLRRLQLAKPWIEMLASDARIFVEIVDWINKTAGRGTVELIAESGDRERTELAGWAFIAGFYEDRLPEFFAWADLDLDEEVYEDYDYQQFELECGAWDSEDQRYYVFEDFGEWRDRYFQPGIRPYMDDGEFAHYRLELKLNDLGRAFLVMDEFLMRYAAELLVQEEGA